MCNNLSHWSTYFKILSSIVISKFNKVAYNSPKTFKLIVLIKTLEKLIKKVIGKRLQFQAINLQISMLAFDIVQLFSSLNHQLLSNILNKTGFDPRISCFFSDYLISRKTQYLWNSFASLFFNVDVGIEQKSALFPILSILYLSPIFYIFQQQTKNLNIPVSLLSFVDDRLIISQEKSFEKTNSFLYCSYNIILSLLKQCGLVIEHEKSEIFYFSRFHSFFNSLSLNLSYIGGPILCSKETWKYLDFIFNNTSPTIPIKHSRPSKAWKCLKI